jgi:hypothetical protein
MLGERAVIAVTHDIIVGYVLRHRVKSVAAMIVQRVRTELEPFLATRLVLTQFGINYIVHDVVCFPARWPNASGKLIRVVLLRHQLCKVVQVRVIEYIQMSFRAKPRFERV